MCVHLLLCVIYICVPEHNVICLYLCAASLLPSVPYGRLEQFTELVVSPKIRAGIGNLSDSPGRTSLKQHFHRQQNMDPSARAGPSPIPQNHQWGGIADLKSLLRYMIKGTYGPVNELQPVPDIPALFTDSIYRVCAAPPASLCTISHVATGVIHLFPLSHKSNAGLTGGQAPVTYGLLSKVPSPKEQRDRAKQAMEKKKNAGVSKAGATANGGEGIKEGEAAVVRVVWHGTGEERHLRKGEIHSGRVWVSLLSNERIVD